MTRRVMAQAKWLGRILLIGAASAGPVLVFQDIAPVVGWVLGVTGFVLAVEWVDRTDRWRL